VKKRSSHASNELMAHLYTAVESKDCNHDWIPLVISRLRRMLTQVYLGRMSEIPRTELIDALNLEIKANN
jgi:hypothetical protein